MSADNGIYIGVFPKADGTREYRVIEACAIENCDHDFGDPNLLDCQRMVYFGDAPAMTEAEAQKTAHRMHEEIYSKGGICEYGVCVCEYDRPLPDKTVAEAQFELDAWFKGEQEKNQREWAERERQTERYYVLVPVAVHEYQGKVGTSGLSPDKIVEYRNRLGKFKTEAEAVAEFWHPYNEDAVNLTGN